MDRKFLKRLMVKGEEANFLIEQYSSLGRISKDQKNILRLDVNHVLENAWGHFPDDFVDKHILNADKMILARKSKRCVGLCVMSIRKVLNFKIHYIEFLLVDKELQGYGLGNFLSQMMVRSEIFKNIFGIIFGKPLEIFFITPNIRVLSNSARQSSFIYPNPYSADENGVITSADEVTWVLAQSLLSQSDNPGRILERNGLVLNGSYANTPWLIYNNDNAPWNKDNKINLFAKKYLGYHEGKDREFMVRMQVNFMTVIKSIFK